MKLYRSFHKKRKFDKLYSLVSEYYAIRYSKKIKPYEIIDWTKICSLNILDELEEIIETLKKNEYDMVAYGNISNFPSINIAYFEKLFWFMAKIQSDEDAIEELTL